MSAAITGPGITRAVPEASAETLRKALAGLTMMAREVVRLKAELADRDDRIRRLEERAR